MAGKAIVGTPRKYQTKTMQKLGDNTKKLLGYWVYAFRHTFLKSVNFFTEFQGDFLRGLISLFALLSVSYLTSSGIVQLLDPKSFLGDFESLTRFLGMLILLLPINFLFRLFFMTPSELFWEQKLIADKYSWSDVNFRVYQFSKDSIFGWGLALSNQKPYEIQCLSAKLIYLIQISDFTNEKKRIAIDDNQNFLPWQKDKDLCEWDEINLPPKSVMKLVLIDENRYKMTWAFYTNRFKMPLEISETRLSNNRNTKEITSQISVHNLYEYLFEIELNAKIGGHSLEPYIFKGRLIKNSKTGNVVVEKI